MGAETPDASARIAVDVPAGLHARPAARFVTTCAAFEARVEIANATTGVGPVAGASLIGIATLAVACGHEILVTARGVDAERAVRALADLAARRFEEPDESDAQVASVAMALPTRAVGAREGVLTGLPAAPGLASGPARRLRRVQRPGAVRAPGTPDQEVLALRGAIVAAREEMRATRDVLAAQAGPEHAAILDAQLLLLDDPALVEPAVRSIAAGEPAERAWDSAVAAAVEAYEALPQAYQRARASDVREAGRQVLGRIAGAAAPPVLWGPGIVIASDLGPSETAALDPAVVAGIATAAGGPTSHTAVIARALGIPAVVGLGDRLLTVPEKTDLLLDGDAGTLVVAPTPADASAFARRANAARADSAPTAPGTARTRDGVEVAVLANVGTPASGAAAAAAGADGIGLLRTEFLFLNRDAPPSEEEQEQALREVIASFDGRPVVVRTLDAGADKPLAYLSRAAEENPALGVRGVRLSLAEPSLAAAQIRSLLRVAADRPLAIMLPMVATLTDWRAGLAQIEAEIDRLGWSERRPNGLRIGAMVEVPSAAICASALAAEADFLSVGTNDLAQYTLAADRASAATGSRADALHPAVLRLVAEVAAAGEERGIPVSVCGEAAADRLAIPLLVGLGVRTLSVAPPLVPAAKGLVGRLDAGAMEDLAVRALGARDADEVRALLLGPGGPVEEV